MNYKHLFYFWKVAKAGSIARAAAELEVRQPTISEQIRALETSLGRKLFDRVGRALVLTEAGELVVERAEQMFLLGDDLARSLQGKPPARTLRVGVDPAIPASLVAQALSNQADIVFELHYTKTAQPIFDFVLTPIRPPRSNQKPILDLPTAFVSKSSAALASQKFLLPGTLTEELYRYFRAQKLKVAIAGNLPTPDLALAFAQQGQGACAVPDHPAAYGGLKVIGRTKAIRWRVYKLEGLKSRVER